MRKTFYSLLLCLLLPLVSHSQQATPSASPAATPAGAPWNVRLEMLIVEMPQAQALALLPSLRDDTKIEAAYAEILAAVTRKEATLIAYPVLLTTSGTKATVEAIEELIYPTQFQPPETHHALATPGAPAISKDAIENLAACPTNFEKRNCGITIEVESVVRPGGKWIDLNIEPHRVAFLGYEWFEALKTPTASSSVQQPSIFTTKTSTNYAVRNGQRILSGFYRLKQPEGQVEVNILQVVATRTDE